METDPAPEEPARPPSLAEALGAIQPLAGIAHQAALKAALDDLLRLHALKLADAARAPALPAILVIAGGTNVGKTTIANAVTGARLGAPSPLARATKAAVAYLHGEDARALGALDFPPGFEQASLGSLDEPNREAGPRPRLFTLAHERADIRGLAIVDTPDIDSVLGQNRDAARGLLYAADAVLFVTSEEKYNDEVCVAYVREALALGKRVLVVLNKHETPEVRDDLERSVLPGAAAAAARERASASDRDGAGAGRAGARDADLPVLPVLYPVPLAPLSGREQALGGAVAELRGAVFALARERDPLRADARAGAARGLLHRARGPLAQLREERQLLDGYAKTAIALADDAARQYRHAIDGLDVVELERVFHLLADALRVPVLDDVYAGLRRATEPVTSGLRRLFGLADPHARALELKTARDREDLRRAEIALGEALAAVRSLAERFDATAEGPLRRALVPSGELGALGRLDEAEHLAALRELSSAWVDEMVRELHQGLRDHPARLRFAQGLKLLLRGGAMGAVLFTGHFGIDNVVLTPVVDLAVSLGSQALINKAYFAKRRSLFLDRRADRLHAIVRERIQAAALARLPAGPSAEAIAQLEGAIAHAVAAATRGRTAEGER